MSELYEIILCHAEDCWKDTLFEGGHIIQVLIIPIDAGLTYYDHWLIVLYVLALDQILILDGVSVLQCHLLKITANGQLI